MNLFYSSFFFGLNYFASSAGKFRLFGSSGIEDYLQMDLVNSHPFIKYWHLSDNDLWVKFGHFVFAEQGA